MDSSLIFHRLRIMKTFLRFFAILFTASFPIHAFAVDTDDDVKPDTDERIAYDQTTTQASADIEAKFPVQAQEVRAALDAHISHATQKNLDAYMEDFVKDRMRYPELEREYAARAMALKDLTLDLKAIEFAALSATSATIHTRQISKYKDDSNLAVVDDAIISYRWIKDSKTGKWQIAFTERRRLQSTN